MSGDKRPYTAQSLNSLNASTKRAEGVYSNNKKVAAHNLAKAAFANHPAVVMNGLGARTHTSGFSFVPAAG